MPKQLCQRFAFICIFTEAKVDVNQLWLKYKHYMCEDFLKRKIRVKSADALALTYVQKCFRLNCFSFDKLGFPAVQYVPSMELTLTDNDYFKICSNLQQI